MVTNVSQLRLDYDPPRAAQTVNPDSQEGRILKYLQSGGRITGLYALNHFGCIHLPSVIYRLKKQKHDIKDRMIEVSGGTKHVKEYWIEAEGAQ